MFAEANEPIQGFTTNDADRDRTKDETVIRELVQNALDASGPNGDEMTEISFIDVPVARDKVPHLGEYETAFKYACQMLEKDEPQTGKQVIRRIERALKGDQVRCLICVDHGQGIDRSALNSLYGQGRSNKLDKGRGSVGAGHLTAFAPSDLRYVLYGGKGEEGNSIFGGHAILATHEQSGMGQATRQRKSGALARSVMSHEQSDEGQVSRHSNHGYIKDVPDDPNQPRLFENEVGAHHIPKILADYIPSSGGSAVMICGYNPISNTKSDLGRLVHGSVAREFLVQVFLGRLAVDVSDAGRLDRDSLEVSVADIQSKRTRKEATRMLKTLRYGDPISSPDLPDTQIWFRSRLEPDEGSRPRVWVFRDGMFIEHSTRNHLDSKQFAGVAPFDAVVNARSNTDFGNLIRQAEGASHNTIRPSELAKSSDSERLRGLLGRLAELLRSKAEPQAAGDVYQPPELLLNILGDRGFWVQPKRYRGDTEVGSGSGSTDKKSKKKNGGRGEGDKKAPVGNTSGISMTCRADPLNPSEFHVSWRFNKQVRGDDEIWLRLYRPSGTDQTSRTKIRPDYYEVVSVQIGGSEQQINIAPGREAQIANLPREGSALVTIKNGSFPSAKDLDRGLVRAEIRRKRRKPSTAKPNGSNQQTSVDEGGTAETT